MTVEQVKNLAKLAKLSISDTEAAELATDLTSVFVSFAELDKIDIAGLMPTYQVTGLSNITRDDVVMQQIDNQELLKNTPERIDDLLKVGKMI